jgi:hypothetical protein
MKNIKFLAYAFFASLFISGCAEEAVNIEGKGDNFFRMPAALETVNLVGFSADPGLKTVPLLEIVRDANSEASLAGAATINLKVDKSIIDAYNADTNHVTKLELLPASLYTTDALDLNFAAGEFSKVINLKVDPAKLDLTKKYALGITATSSGGYKVRSGLDKGLFQMIAKNKYDGNYKSTGYFTHPTATSSRAIDRLKTLVTVDATTSETELGDLGGSGYLMHLKVNADNTVTIIPKGASPAPLNQSYGPNTYDPKTQTFTLWYSYNVAAPRIIQEVIKKK